MSNSKLIELSYYDPSAQVRLSAYADTIVLDHDQNGSIISAIRFGGYPEMVRAMADAIYGGATIEAAQNDTTRMLQSSLKSYQRQITHDGIYAVATLMAADTVQEDDRSGKHEKDEDTNLVDTEQMELQPRRCYIFCPARDQKRLFEELDHKTAAPLIPEFQDYVLSSLRQRGDLRQLEVISLKERMDAWVLDLKPQDQNVVEVLEQGLQSGDIQIPGAVPNMPDVFENVENVTGYLNTFGVTVADRIRNQFMPLFDPAKEPLSDEVLAINDCIMSRVGYSLYDAQLAVAEAVKRQLARKRVALIIAECGSGKTKIGSTALGALHGLWADQKRKDGRKSFGIVMCPSHVTQKWVREIGETLPDTYGMVVRTIQDLNRLYAMYEKGDKSVFAVFSKEQARDGYMRYPAVRWNRRRRAFLCPDCDGVIEMEISEDGSRYTVPADQFFFQKEHKKNHTCPHCGTPLWSAVNPDKRIDWVKIGEYGWVYRYGAQAHLHRTKNERVLDQLTEIAQNPDAFYPIRGAHQRFPLSTYIKKKLRGRIDGFLCDELHEYNNNSGQGDAMAELYGASRCFVGMTATLINGYSSGIFHLLYRIVPGLMLKDGKRYKSPGDFDAEYGVVENTYEIQDAEYNSNIVLLDEIFKCNDGVLNSLLTALNERKYTNEGRTYPIPVISFFAASNEIPNFNDPQEKILEALYDRLELKVVTANMEDRDTRLAVLKNKQTGAFGQISATITLEELRQMQQEVASIPVPDAINELADDILCELRKDMAVSDRKYLGYYPIAQAKAWLSGHDKVESCDLLALKNYLWHLPSDREKVEAVLTRLCVNPMQDKVNNIRGMALESQEEFDAALGDGSKADTARKAFIKLRGELTHLYQMQCSLRTAAQSDSEIALVDDLLADLEKISRKAHEQTHFTYTTLEEIAALN